jgi:citrate synthase
MEPWRTAIVHADATGLWIRGYDVTALMQRGTFTDTIFLLHLGRMPSQAERTLLDAILTGVADHGPGAPSCAAARLAASGNRQSIAAAVGAGLLAIGEEHGGAGPLAMQLIAEGVRRAHAESITLDTAAEHLVDEAVRSGRRLPGLGHRAHTTDPRTATLFGLARAAGLAGDGVRFFIALEAAARTRIKPLPINIDGSLAALLYDMGFAPEAAMHVFIIGRVAGITAEVAEERLRERPMRIRIPVAYDGEPPREL